MNFCLLGYLSSVSVQRQVGQGWTLWWPLSNLQLTKDNEAYFLGVFVCQAVLEVPRELVFNVSLGQDSLALYNVWRLLLASSSCICRDLALSKDFGPIYSLEDYVQGSFLSQCQFVFFFLFYREGWGMPSTLGQGFSIDQRCSIFGSSGVLWFYFSISYSKEEVMMFFVHTLPISVQLFIHIFL